jgi:hypothetical protein
MRGERARVRTTLSPEQALRDVEPFVPHAAWATNPTQTRYDNRLHRDDRVG